MIFIFHFSFSLSILACIRERFWRSFGVTLLERGTDVIFYFVCLICEHFTQQIFLFLVNDDSVGLGLSHSWWQGLRAGGSILAGAEAELSESVDLVLIAGFLIRLLVCGLRKGKGHLAACSLRVLGRYTIWQKLSVRCIFFLFEIRKQVLQVWVQLGVIVQLRAIIWLFVIAKFL